jgi:hypothetical protein
VKTSTKISVRSSSLPISSLAELLFPISPFFKLQYVFQNLKKTIRGPQRKSKICLRPLNMFFLFIEISWSIVGANLKYYLRELNVILNKSPISITFPINLQLNRGENGKYNSSSKNRLKT